MHNYHNISHIYRIINYIIINSYSQRYTQSQCFSDNSCQALKLPQIPSELNKNIISSIYQEDYMNMNEQLRQKQKPHPLNHPRRRNVYAESIAQSSYQSPLIKDTLKGYTTRYECNKEMVIEAKGIGNNNLFINFYH